VHEGPSRGDGHALGGEVKDLQLGAPAAQRRGDFPRPVVAHARIGNQHVHERGLEEGEQGVARVRGADDRAAFPLQHAPRRLAEVRIVRHDEDAGLRVAPIGDASVLQRNGNPANLHGGSAESQGRCRHGPGRSGRNCRAAPVSAFFS